MSFNFKTLILAALVTVATFVSANKPDQSCLNACTDYSIVLGNCRNEYGNLPIYHDDSANEFLTCLCDGNKADDKLGFDAMNDIVGICSSCTSTPHVIRSQLEQLVALCAVLQSNGTVVDADKFTPTSYTPRPVGNATPDGEATSSAITLHRATFRMLVLVSVLFGGAFHYL